METLFSASTGGFYSSARPDGIPDDAVTISSDEYMKLLEGQAEGKIIKPDETGYPTLISPPEPSPTELAMIERDQKLAVANQQISILKPAVDGGYAKPEHTSLLADWQRCRYELTLVPEQPGWPDKPQWPTEPEKVI